jgi:hypothetical protein
MKAYIDSNIIIELEDNTISKNQLNENFENKIDFFYYSFPHLFEAYEISGTDEQKSERLDKRFESITNLTENNYILYNTENHKFETQVSSPESIYKNIPDVNDNIEEAKQLANKLSIEQKKSVKKLFGIDSIELNNFTPEQVKQQIETRKELFGGLSFDEFLAEAKEEKYPNEEIKLYDQISSLMELLDMYGFWKDKPTIKSNYARSLDGIHIFISTFCDFFITNDTRSRNKAIVIFDLLNINTKVLDMNGK